MLGRGQISQKVPGGFVYFFEHRSPLGSGFWFWPIGRSLEVGSCRAGWHQNRSLIECWSRAVCLSLLALVSWVGLSRSRGLWIGLLPHSLEWNCRSICWSLFVMTVFSAYCSCSYWASLFRFSAIGDHLWTIYLLVGTFLRLSRLLLWNQCSYLSKAHFFR